MTFTAVQLSGMLTREYAEHDDKTLGVSEITPWGRSPDAIGGAYGVAWYEVFEDERGRLYKVFCTDGVRGGHGPYRNPDAGDD